LVPQLVQYGYRVVVPAMRGYAPSSVSHSGDYHVSALARDANDLHEHLGGDERAVLIGHDWGAAATYVATNAQPARWRRAVTIAIPPLAVFAETLTHFEQLRASWYMFFFQNDLAEPVVGLDDLAFLGDLWRAWSPLYEPAEDLVVLRAALASQENLHAALEYYRAIFSPRLIEPRLPDVASVATLYLHGANDGCFLASGLGRVLDFLAANSRFTLVEDAGHFVHLEQPTAVHRAVGDFLAD
ncbi:MAG: alpha/beta hydrolase, partial [Acidimicrobiales bacterium]